MSISHIACRLVSSLGTLFRFRLVRGLFRRSSGRLVVGLRTGSRIGIGPRDRWVVGRFTEDLVSSVSQPASCPGLLFQNSVAVLADRDIPLLYRNALLRTNKKRGQTHRRPPTTETRRGRPATPDTLDHPTRARIPARSPMRNLNGRRATGFPPLQELLRGL